jgi:hypothetical protein
MDRIRKVGAAAPKLVTPSRSDEAAWQGGSVGDKGQIAGPDCARLEAQAQAARTKDPGMFRAHPALDGGVLTEHGHGGYVVDRRSRTLELDLADVEARDRQVRDAARTRLRVVTERAHRRGLDIVTLRPGKYALVRQTGASGVETISVRTNLNQLLIDVARCEVSREIADTMAKQPPGGAK